jgi:hypothetical protein
MAWLANVRRETGYTRHLVSRGPGIPIEGIPSVARVVIYAAEHGYYLLRYSTADEIVADTWHQSLDDAQSQARREYLIDLTDWREAPIALELLNPGASNSQQNPTGF